MQATKIHETTNAKSSKSGEGRGGARLPPPRSGIAALDDQLVQARLQVGEPDDPYEREADRIADQVLRMPESAPPSDRPSPTPIAATVQRKCAACEEEGLDGLVQREGEGEAAISSGVTTAIAGLRTSGGHPLPAELRGFFEPRFGADFGDVRVHSDARAGEVARGLRARAFTIGRDVVFGAGQYQPHTQSGRRLLAHELTHVIQQGSMSSPTIQREVDPNTTTIRTPTVDHRYTEITRTLEPRPCRATNTTVQTPPGQIFYWDQQAQAVGLRYTLCHGRVRLSTGGSIEYDRLVQAATQLLGNVLQNPGDINRSLQRALETATISSSGQITFTFNGVLQARVTGQAQGGANAQSFQVRGQVIVAPSGQWRFMVEGGVGFDRNSTGSQTTYTFTGRVGNDDVSFGVEYQRIEFAPAGLGAPTNENRWTGVLTIPIPEPNRVNCRRCDCPPPLPRYTCRSVREEYDEPTVVREHGIQRFHLLHVYDDVTPADQPAFRRQLEQISGLLANESHVVSIDGVASPEANVRYNRALALRRATYTRGQLEGELQQRQVTATLPVATGRGEDLGESSRRPGEAGNEELINEIKRRLENLDEDRRLDLLGVDQQIRADRDRRRRALDDIEAFIRGSENGVPLARRARWEKIFPFLRRTEVVVDVHLQRGTTHVEGERGPAGNCSRTDLEYANANMPAIPAGQRVPLERCE